MSCKGHNSIVLLLGANRSLSNLNSLILKIDIFTSLCKSYASSHGAFTQSIQVTRSVCANGHGAQSWGRVNNEDRQPGAERLPAPDWPSLEHGICPSWPPYWRTLHSVSRHACLVSCDEVDEPRHELSTAPLTQQRTPAGVAPQFQMHRIA